MKKITILTMLLVVVLTLSACSKWAKQSSDEQIYKGQSAQQINDSAQQALTKGNYSTAIKRYEALDALYPFSPYSQAAERNLIYAYYKNGEMTAASATADRYIHLYP